MPQRMSRRGLLQGAGAGLILVNCKDSCQPSGGSGAGPAAADAGGTATATKKRDTVRVGLIMTLSGPQGSIGKDIEQGVMLALEQAGMRAGGKTIEILKRDDKNDPQVGGELAKELVEKEKVDLVIGPSHSHVMLALRNVLHDGKTILLNPNAGASSLAGALCSPYIFTTGRMNPLYAEAMGRYLAKKGTKSVAVLAANFSAGLDMVQGFRETFVNEGEGKVVAEILPPLTTTDFSTYLNQLKSVKADAVFAFFGGELAVHFIKQYSQAGLKGKLPLYVTGYTVEQDVLPAQGDAALGIISIGVYSPMLDNEANKKFAPAYKAKYTAYPSEYSALGFDTAQLLLSSLNSIGGNIEDKVALLNALNTAKIDSPRGPFKFGPNHTPVQDAYLREVVRAPDGSLVNKVVATAWPNYYFPGEGCMLPGVKR